MYNALSQYTRELESKIKETLPGVIELDVDAVHDFRVAIKKTRTVINFLDYLTYGQINRRRLMAGFRPVFRKTGLIRELHINKSLVPEIAELSGLDIEFLDRKINYQIIRNRKFLEQTAQDFGNKAPQLFENIQAQILNAGNLKTRVDPAENYQLRLGKKIRKQISSDKPDLHKARKDLKQKIYIFDALQESELLGFYREFRAEWKILETTIGKWHDHATFREWLIPGLKWKRLSDRQYKSMIKLIAYLRASTGRMEKELIKTMKRK